MKWQGRLTPSTTLWEGTSLGQMPQGFQYWDAIGIDKLEKVWDAKGIVPFEHLQKEYKMHQSQWFKYRQLRHTLQRTISSDEETHEDSPLELRLHMGHMHCKAISLTYGMLMRNTQGTLEKLKARWKEDLGDLDGDDWQDTLGFPGLSTI